MKPRWKGPLAQEGIRAYGTLTAITEVLTGRSSPDTYSQSAFLSHILGASFLHKCALRL